MKKKLGILLLFIVSFIFIDQLIKFGIKLNFVEGQSQPLIGNWLVLNYIENPGMAFGTTFGTSIWAKIGLSLFRVVAILAIGYYLWLEIKKGSRFEYLFAVSLIFVGALGNLFDSMFYDFIFSFDPCNYYNYMEGTGNFENCVQTIHGQTYSRPIEVRHHGFLLGNVVDMFQFNVQWPNFIPYLGGKQIFPAIWNFADFCISSGVGMILIRNRTYFPKVKK
ncbi:signal peptidase II [Crocinitomicaceae bacterium]|nr:signal peptidase II [Crocinitomicaceae bacterium]